tara:strand:+ start:44 stop:598 length:555 start_codon:yes stop_codon:yes gene_type:complete
MIVAANRFVKRQVKSSRFSHFDGSWTELEQLVVENWEKSKPGYRAGVILISVPAENFYSSMVNLTVGDKLVGEFIPRRKGESPRKTLGVSSRSKIPACSVEIVLYSSGVLAESGDNDLPAGEDNWEIISINASITKGDTPIHPSVLMHNHFGSSGGTATNLSDGDFVEMLRESFQFWSDKATCA